MKKSEQIRDKCTPSVRENSFCRKLAMETAQPIVERSGVFEKMDIRIAYRLVISVHPSDTLSYS